MNRTEIFMPLTDDKIKNLTAGQLVYLSGEIYTARDAAHKQLMALMQSGQEAPFPFEGAAVYYAGPCPAKPGQVIGSAGPTTSGRMDAYSPYFIEKGLKVMIGKGLRSQEVIDAIVKWGGVYFSAIGGAAALISKCIKKSELIAFEELGPESIRKLTVERFPLVTAIDCKGNSILI